MNRNLRSIDSMAYVFTAYFSTLPLNASRNENKTMHGPGLLTIHD